MDNLSSFYETHKEQKVSFVVRTNVDKENAPDIPLLYKMLHEKFGNFYDFGLAPVEEFSKNEKLTKTPL